MRELIYGTDNVDFLEATRTIRESLYGFDGNDEFVFYQENGVKDLSDRFFGGAGNDWLGTVELSQTGKGFFKYNEFAGLSFDGGDGYDTLSAKLTADLSLVEDGAKVLKVHKFATSAVSVEHRVLALTLEEDLGAQDFAISGSGRDETLAVTQTGSVEGGGTLSIATRGGRDIIHYSATANLEALNVNTGKGSDFFQFDGAWNISATLTVTTGGGADTVVINGSTISYPDALGATIRTGRGEDTIVLEGMHSETVKAGGGSDDIYVLTGGFQTDADVIFTGGGRDRVFLELDAYSTIAEFRDFSAAQDVIVFDAWEDQGLFPRNTEVTFDRAEWENAQEDRLFMDNSSGKLHYGSNVLADFGGPTSLTAGNFTSSYDWEY